MKIIKYIIVLLLIISCSKKGNVQDQNKKWEVDISSIGVNTEVIDISKDFYNLEMPVSEFRKKYPFYLDPQFPDAQYEKQRKDTTELNKKDIFF